MDDFLREIGITQKGNISDDGCYVIDFDDYDDWVKAQSRLERSNIVYELTDTSNIGEEYQSLQYVNDEYSITLNADLDADKYQLICKEN